LPAPVAVMDAGVAHRFAPSTGDHRRWRERPGDRDVEIQILKKSEIRVGTHDPVETGSACLLVQNDDANVRVGQNVPTKPECGEVARERGALASLLNIED